MFLDEQSLSILVQVRNMANSLEVKGEQNIYCMYNILGGLNEILNKAQKEKEKENEAIKIEDAKKKEG